MNKVVNIYPKYAITTVNPPIRSTVYRVTKSTSEIRNCIIARAVVEEILPDGSTITLNFSNYDKDNTPSKIDKVISKIEEKAAVIEESVAESTEEPVVKPVEVQVKKEADTNKSNNFNSKYNNKKFKNNYQNHINKIDTKKDSDKSESEANTEPEVKTIDVESI